MKKYLKLFWGILFLFITVEDSQAAKFTRKNPTNVRRLTAFAQAAGIPKDYVERIIDSVVACSAKDSRILTLENVAPYMRKEYKRLSGGSLFCQPPADLDRVEASLPLKEKLRIEIEVTRKAVSIEQEEAKKREAETARLNTAATRIQDGIREHLAYKKKRAEYAERERSHQAELMIASGIFSEDRDKIRLGAVRTAARHILSKIEVYMDSVIPLCRDAYQAIEKGEADPSEMPPHMSVYKEILERVVPDDRHWVKPKDVVMAQDEETIRATIESVDEILAKAEYGRVARGMKRFNGLDPETNFIDDLPRG